MGGYTPAGNLLGTDTDTATGQYVQTFTQAANAVTNVGTLGQGLIYSTASITYATTTVNWYPEPMARDWYEREMARYEREVGRMHAYESQFVQMSQSGESPQKSDAAQAQEKARALLLRFLSPAQRGDYEARNYFDVEAPSGIYYRLYKERVNYGNVCRLSEDRRRQTHAYCIHIYGVPREDELLGFKLMLEANERFFLQTANATPL